jgi:hypothetical protein
VSLSQLTSAGEVAYFLQGTATPSPLAADDRTSDRRLSAWVTDDTATRHGDSTRQQSTRAPVDNTAGTGANSSYFEYNI